MKANSGPKLRSQASLYHLITNGWTRWVGMRYLRSKKSSRFLSFITILSMGGVALGVTAIIVVLSVMDGFERELKKRLMAGDLHVLVEPTSSFEGYDSGFVDKEADRRFEFLNNHPLVKTVSPIVGTEAILRIGRKVTGVVVKGVEKPRLEMLRAQIVETAEPQMMVRREGPDTFRLPGLFIGQEMAYLLENCD